MGWGGVGAGRGVDRERRTRGVGGWGLNGLCETGPWSVAEAAANYHQLGNALSARAHVSLGAQDGYGWECTMLHSQSSDFPNAGVHGLSGPVSRGPDSHPPGRHAGTVGASNCGMQDHCRFESPIRRTR